MAFENITVEIRIGNVESRVIGPVPKQRLDRVLNPNLTWHPDWADGPISRPTAVVYHPPSGIFLTGALPTVKRELKRAGVRTRLRDHRSTASPRYRWELRGWELRDYQAQVVDQALKSGHGLIDIGTSGGKSLLAAAIIARLGLPTIYIVTTRTLLHQTRENLHQFLGVQAGVIGQGILNIRPVTTALIQGLDPDKQDLSQFNGGVLIFDEGHHAAALTYQDLIRRINPRYHFYLSAVPFRNGQDQAVLDALAGARLTEGKYSAQFLIERGYASPVEVQLEVCRIRGAMAEMPFADLYQEFVVLNPKRNQRIAEITRTHLERGHSVLILVEQVRHGHELHRLLGNAARFVHGSTPRVDLRDTTHQFAQGSLMCLIATSGLFQEGISINGIHVLIQAGGLKSRSKVIQSLGRGMRRAPGKEVCTYVDFYDDDTAGILRAHARERMRVLREEGFPVPSVEESLSRVSTPTGSDRYWCHVPETERFVQVDVTGRVRGKAVCLRKSLVPNSFCKKCQQPTLCMTGGKILWQDDPA